MSSDDFPEIASWSPRVTLVLGLNPGPFVCAGTNTYLIGTGSRRILLDTGHGVPEYIELLERAMKQVGCEAIQEVVLTHNHPDHNGGLIALRDHFGPIPITKKVIDSDAIFPFEFKAIEDGDAIETEGATLRALFTPGHALDHLCYFLEEESAIFTGDNILGTGTSVIPAESGDLLDYMHSLERLKAQNPKRLYPGHGPLIERGVEKINEYISHRRQREAEILHTLRDGKSRVSEMVEIIYADIDKLLHIAAAQSVAAHLLKLEREKRVRRQDASVPVLEAEWELSDSILELLQSDSAAVRSGACLQAVHQETTTELVLSLGGALADSEKSVSRAAIGALAQLGKESQEVQELLDRLLRGNNQQQRWGSACVLARLRPPHPKLLPVFVETLSHSDGDVRWAAAQLIVSTGRIHGEVHPLLVGLARGADDSLVRRMAVYCLRELAPEHEETASAMLDASRDADVKVQRAALTAMAALLDPPASIIERILEVLHDAEDPGSRRIAPITLSELEARNPGAIGEEIWGQLRDLADKSQDASFSKAVLTALERSTPDS